MRRAPPSRGALGNRVLQDEVTTGDPVVDVTALHSVQRFQGHDTRDNLLNEATTSLRHIKARHFASLLPVL